MQETTCAYFLPIELGPMSGIRMPPNTGLFERTCAGTPTRIRTKIPTSGLLHSSAQRESKQPLSSNFSGMLQEFGARTPAHLSDLNSRPLGGRAVSVSALSHLRIQPRSSAIFGIARLPTQRRQMIISVGAHRSCVKPASHTRQH